jgi:ribosomal protein S18 acetylase RimI-like enzyme
LLRLYKNLSKGNVLSDKGNYAELLSIGALPDQNGLGIGQQLLAKFENQVKEKGVNIITLTTDLDSNDSVLRLQKIGIYYLL